MSASAATRTLSREVLLDKIRGGWAGQMIGVSYGAPTEFRSNGKIDEGVLSWAPERVDNALGQDDLYVEMTFLRSLEQYGIDVSIRQAGIDFANSRYPLWCANNAGRTNLRRGIAPPDSSHPKFNKCPNDIDYQIEADVIGILGSIYFYCYAAMQFPAGLLSDSVGPRRTVTFSLLLAALGSLVLGLAPSITVALVARGMPADPHLDADDHVVSAQSQVAQNLDALDGLHFAVQVMDFDAQLQ